MAKSGEGVDKFLELCEEVGDATMIGLVRDWFSNADLEALVDDYRGEQESMSDDDEEELSEVPVEWYQCEVHPNGTTGCRYCYGFVGGFHESWCNYLT